MRRRWTAGSSGLGCLVAPWTCTENVAAGLHCQSCRMPASDDVPSCPWAARARQVDAEQIV